MAHADEHLALASVVCVCVCVCMCMCMCVCMCVVCTHGLTWTKFLLDMDTCQQVGELHAHEYIYAHAHTCARAQMHAQGPTSRQSVQPEGVDRDTVWRHLFESPAVLDAAQLIGAYGLMQRISFQDRAEDDFLSF